MKKKLKIALLAPFEERVPPKKYGGIELVIYSLAEELIKRNHRVTLFATGDSKTSANLFPALPKSLRSTKIGSDSKTRGASKILGTAKTIVALRNKKFDIIHNHNWYVVPFISLLKSPVVTTIHYPLDINYQRIIYREFPGLSYISVSKNQRKPIPNLNFVGNVYNGIDINIFPFNEKPKDYLAFLGRMSPVKGPVEAIKIAKKTKIKLIMAAKVDLADEKYFSNYVKPLIDGKQIKFVGELGHKKKVELLKNALALLAPIQWREPFGFFFIEAMACGTPVITYKKGSTSEVINHKKTGFVVKTPKKMIEAVKNINSIKRKDCRSWVEKYFTIEKMVDGYEKVYFEILKRKT